MNAAEVLSIPKKKDELIRRIDPYGFEKIDRALDGGKGAILVSAHFGNWELQPVYYCSRGYTVSVIARRIYYEKYDEWVRVLRESTGVNIIFRDESPKKVISVLKNNNLLGVLPDQDIDSIEGVFVDFFGKTAYTPSAPVVLAMKMGSPILPCFIVRNKNRHKAIVGDPIKMEITGNKEEDIRKNTQLWTSAVESYIRKYPEQWVWMHKRWKTKQK